MLSLQLFLEINKKVFEVEKYLQNTKEKKKSCGIHPVFRYERLLKIIQRLFLLVAAREMNAKQMTLNIMCKYWLYILIFLEKFGVV